MGAINLAIGWLNHQGRGNLGASTSRLAGGFANRQLRLVDWLSATLGTLDFGDYCICLQPEVAHIDQPGLREAMTLFAVACAGLFPLIPIPGRPWIGVLHVPIIRARWGLWPAVSEPAESGTSSRCPRMGQFPVCCSGSWDCCRTLATLRDRAKSRLATSDFRQCCRWDGAGRRGTGTGINRRICCWAGLANTAGAFSAYRG